MPTMTLSLVVACSIMGAMGSLQTHALSDRAFNEILFEKPTDTPGQRLVLVRGPDFDPKLLRFWDSERTRDATGLTFFERIQRAYELRLELHTEGSHKPIILAGRLRLEGRQQFQTGTSVLDMLVEPGEIHVVLAEGWVLAIWRVWPGATNCTMIGPNQWRTVIAAAGRLEDYGTDAKLTRLEDGRLSLEVIEQTSSSTRHAHLEEEKKHSLEFKYVRERIAKK